MNPMQIPSSDQQSQGFDPATGQPGDPAMNPGGQPVSEEQKQELITMINQIREKLKRLSVLKFASENKKDEMRRAMLRQVFEKLQLTGVDLSDRQSVSDFLNNLKQDNPELATMFEQSMDALLGSDDYQNNMNNINTNENIPQNISEPIQDSQPESMG